MAGLYVHVPFCLRRCPYCDFTVAVTSKVPAARFVDAVLEEVRIRRHELASRTLRTIYLGGGTPSILPPGEVERLLDGARALLSEVMELDLREVTIEANPEHVSGDSALAWRTSGVTRVSLGAQALRDDVLAVLGRSHTGADVRRSVDAVRHAGIEHCSVDLIFGAPGDSLERFVADVDLVAGWNGVDHLSVYELTWEPRTAFSVRRRRGLLSAWSDDALADAYAACGARLGSAGFERYETSSFARAAGRSEHNQGYWLGHEYLGVGPGAHSLRIGGEPGPVSRRANAPSTRRYLDAVAAAPEFETISSAQHLRELIALGLRRSDPLDVGLLRDRFANDWPLVDGPVRAWIDRGLAVEEPGGLRFSEAARALADTLAEDVF